MHSENKKAILGEGLISGYLSIFFSLLSFGAVLCFIFPEYLTTQEFRINYPIDVFRWMIFGALAFSFLFAFLSLLLSKKAKYAFIGMSTFDGGCWGIMYMCVLYHAHSVQV